MRLPILTLAAMVAAGSTQLAVSAAHAQVPTSIEAAAVAFTDNYGALFYYRTTNESIDVAAAAAMSKEVRSAGPFEKVKRQAEEEARIRNGLNLASGDRLLTMSVSAVIRPYDPVRQEFSIDLFEANKFVPFEAYGRQFRLLFENAEAYRALKMPEAEARKINDKSFARPVTVTVDFHLSGAGDPTGMMASSNAVRAIVTRVRILDGGRPILPDIVVAGAPIRGAATPPTMSATDWTIQGLHLGTTKTTFEATARSAFGGSAKFAFGRDDLCGGTMTPVPGYSVVAGTVCVTFVADSAAKIGQFTVKQILSNDAVAADGGRKVLIDKFGPVAFSDGAGGLGWGECVGPRQARNYTVYATYYGAQTSAGMTSGTRGTPALAITVTDPDFARSRLPNAGGPTGAVEPKL